MALNDDKSAKRVLKKGVWTAEEDRKLADSIEKYGPKKWRTLATKSGYMHIDCIL